MQVYDAHDARLELMNGYDHGDDDDDDAYSFAGWREEAFWLYYDTYSSLSPSFIKREQTIGIPYPRLPLLRS